MEGRTREQDRGRRNRGQKRDRREGRARGKEKTRTKREKHHGRTTRRSESNAKFKLTLRKQGLTERSRRNKPTLKTARREAEEQNREACKEGRRRRKSKPNRWPTKRLKNKGNPRVQEGVQIARRIKKQKSNYRAKSNPNHQTA